MIDPQVAYDKLAQMACGQIVDFFEAEGVVGVREGLYSCPIARWLRETTGQQFAVSDTIFNENHRFELTGEMELFINAFDTGQYISLDANYEPDEDY